MKNNTVLNCGTFADMTTDEMMAVDGGSFWSWYRSWYKKHWKEFFIVALS